MTNEPTERDIDLLFLRHYGLAEIGEDPLGERIAEHKLAEDRNPSFSWEGQYQEKVELTGQDLKQPYWAHDESYEEARRLAFLEYLVHEKGFQRR